MNAAAIAASSSRFFYLKHLPFDYLKIDGEFVRGVTDNRADQILVKSLVQIASELGKRTIAEFVEDQATLDMIQELGVDFAQGYHIGKPAALPSPASTKPVASVSSATSTEYLLARHT